MNSKAEAFFQWFAGSSLNTGLLFGVGVACPYGLQGCCSVGNGHVSGSFMESYGSLMICKPRYAGGLKIVLVQRSDYPHIGPISLYGG